MNDYQLTASPAFAASASEPGHASTPAVRREFLAHLLEQVTSPSVAREVAAILTQRYENLLEILGAPEHDLVALGRGCSDLAITVGRLRSLGQQQVEWLHAP